MADNHDRELLSLTEAARELGLSWQATHRWIRYGNLRAERVGNFYVIRRTALEAFREWWRANPHVRRQLAGARPAGDPEAN